MPGRLKLWGAAARRTRRQRFESLEIRRLLSAAPLVPEPPAALWARTSQPMEADHFHFSVFEGPLEESSSRAAAAVGPFAAEPASDQFLTAPPDSARLAAFNELIEAASTEPPLVEVIFVPASPYAPAGAAFASTLAGESFAPPAFAHDATLNADLFTAPLINALSDGALSDGALSDGQTTPSLLRAVDQRAFDGGGEHALFFVQDVWQPGALGMFGGPDGTADAHLRAAELLRAPPAEERLAMLPLDGVRSSNGALAYFDSAADVERHASAGFAVVFGQSAEDETSGITGRGVVGALPAGTWVYAAEVEPILSAAHGAAWYLMAFDDTISANAGAVQAAQSVEQAVSSLMREVRAPRFALDAAALTVAINDLVAEADEIRLGLLEVLSPLASGEAAFASATLGAGLAYHYWRATRSERRSDEKRLLLSRLTHLHASLGIDGGAP